MHSLGHIVVVGNGPCQEAARLGLYNTASIAAGQPCHVLAYMAPVLCALTPHRTNMQQAPSLHGMCSAVVCDVTVSMFVRLCCLPC